MADMFSFSFALIAFIILSVSGQTDKFNTVPLNDFEKASLFSQFQREIDNSNRVLSSSSQSDLLPSNQNQLISCFRVRPNVKNAYPADNTKYFICRDEKRFEIMTCPNGGIFNETEKACIDLCDQTKPCLNQGQCIILPNLTLECVCRRDWTGERCEIPKSTCANNPCGLNSECRMLKAFDYPQDYVCLCNNQKTYGRDCQQTVPNPCLSNLQQFHPFAFSRRAYINCDDEMIFFQPCNSLLYWNQEEKRCDRSLPDLLRAPFAYIKSPKTQKPEMQSTMAQSAQRQNTVTMQDQLSTGQLGQWRQNQPLPMNTQMNQFQRMKETQQQQQNLPTFSQGMDTQPWMNQVPEMQTQTNQRFTMQSQPWQSTNQQPMMNTFMETTTAAPRIFHLQGFASRMPEESQWQGKTLTSPQMRFGPKNTIDQQTTIDSVPTFQLKSWKS